MGMELGWWKVLWWTARLLAGKHAYRGKHRTEVGGRERNGAWMAEGPLVDSLASERNVKSEPTIPTGHYGQKKPRVIRTSPSTRASGTPEFFGNAVYQRVVVSTQIFRASHSSNKARGMPSASTRPWSSESN